MDASPLLAASSWGLAIGIAMVMFVFLIIGYVVIQGTRVQLAWRTSVEQGDVDAIHTLVSEEVARWKAIRMPKGTSPAVWHGVQSVEVVEVAPDGIRVSALAEGEFASVSGERRQTSSAFRQGVQITARLADMVLYDIPNVRLDFAHVDIYSTYRDDRGSVQRCIMSTRCPRTVANEIDWEEMDAEEIVRIFGGRFRLDDRGEALPIEVDAPAANSVPAAFYKDGD